jgi:predicted transcriptional regulator
MRKKFTTSLDVEITDTIKHIAIDKKTDVSKIIEELLKEYIAKYEKQKAKP